MKKNLFNKAIATGLVLSLVGANSVFAVTDAGTTLSGTTEVKSPVYNLVVPTTLALTLDPFELGTDAPSSLYGGDYKFINKSNVPIRVDVSTTVVPATGVTQATVEEVDDSTANVNNINKLFSVEMLSAGVAATDVVLEDTTPKDFKAATPIVYAAAGDFSNLVGKVATGKKDSVVTLALNKATIADAVDYKFVDGTDSVVEDGVAAFTVRGSLNANAKWLPADLKLAAKISLRGMSTSTYGDIDDTSNPTLAEAHRVITSQDSDSKPAAFVVPTLSTFTAASGDNTATGIIGDGGLKATAVTVSLRSSDGEIIPLTVTTDYTFTITPATGATSLKLLGGSGKKIATLGTGTYTVIVQYNNSAMTVIDNRTIVKS